MTALTVSGNSEPESAPATPRHNLSYFEGCRAVAEALTPPIRYNGRATPSATGAYMTDEKPSLPGKPFQRKVTKDQQAQIEQLSDQGGMTQSQIAETLQIPESTVAYYARAYRKRKEEVDELASAHVRSERTPDKLQELLQTIPGIGDAKARYAVTMYKANPMMKDTPMELYDLLLNGLNLTPFAAGQAVKAFFSDVFARNPQAAQGLFPMGQPGAWGAQPMSYPGTGQYQPVQTPTGVVYVPQPQAPGGQRPLTENEVRRIAEETQAEQLVEIDEPIFGADGKPLIGTDGRPVVRHIRRPVSAGAGEDGMMKSLQFFQLMGLVRPPQQASDTETIARAVAQALNGGRSPESDALRTQMGQIQAELAAARARAEADVAYKRVIDDKNAQITDAQLRAATASAGLPAEQQAAVKFVEAGDKAASQFIANADKRMDRVEKMVEHLVSLVRPQGVAQPTPESQIQALAKAGEQPPQG